MEHDERDGAGSGPERLHVLIAGGGVAALEAALALRALAGELVDVELLAPEFQFTYRPLAVAEPFGLGEVRRFELRELAAAAGARLTQGRLASVEAAARVARTEEGDPLPYGALLIACGAVPEEAVAGAHTFRGPSDTGMMRRLLDAIDAGDVRRVVFAVPHGAVWALPLYELALLTAARGGRGRELEIVIATPEEEPLQLFGRAASEAMRALLDELRIEFHPGVIPAEVQAGELRLLPRGAIAADEVVALPRLEGERIDGIPQTLDGFVFVDLHGRVIGVPDVYAAGDITTFPVKQGGIAAQQAESAAAAIAAHAGAGFSPRPFRPILRGLLLTGGAPRYLRAELEGERESTVDVEPLWWPPAKIVGHYLAPFLAALAGVELPPELPEARHALRVEVELEPEPERIVAQVPEPWWEDAEAADAGGAKTVADVMSSSVLVVAPEDTLGEVAAQMRAADYGSALVAEFGRLIGILTSRDLLRSFAERVHPSEARVREWMTAAPIALPATAPVDVALAVMAERGVHHLPVIEGERPIGIVGMRAVTRAAAAQARSSPPVGLGF